MIPLETIIKPISKEEQNIAADWGRGLANTSLRFLEAFSYHFKNELYDSIRSYEHTTGKSLKHSKVEKIAEQMKTINDFFREHQHKFYHPDHKEYCAGFQNISAEEFLGQMTNKTQVFVGYVIQNTGMFLPAYNKKHFSSTQQLQLFKRSNDFEVIGKKLQEKVIEF